MRERVFSQVPDQWNRAYKAGIFTEFMEQRAPGHTTLDGTIYRRGMLDFKTEIVDGLAGLDYLKDPEAADKAEDVKAEAKADDAKADEAKADDAKAETKADAKPEPAAESRQGVRLRTSVKDAMATVEGESWGPLPVSLRVSA